MCALLLEVSIHLHLPRPSAQISSSFELACLTSGSPLPQELLADGGPHSSTAFLWPLEKRKGLALANKTKQNKTNNNINKQKLQF